MKNGVNGDRHFDEESSASKLRTEARLLVLRIEELLNGDILTDMQKFRLREKIREALKVAQDRNQAYNIKP